MNAQHTNVPEDPGNPGHDVLGVGLAARGHYIHNAMVSAAEPMPATEIGKRAEELARRGGYPCKPMTFAAQTTRSHLVFMRNKSGGGFVEQLPDGRWQLTERAWHRINNPDQPEPAPTATGPASLQGVRTVDDKGRILLPKEFANATVTIEMTSDTEICIRKAVVVPEAALPLMEDHIKPLSDRDRDLFLDLLDNPPKPTQAFRDAAKQYKNRHG